MSAWNVSLWNFVRAAVSFPLISPLYVIITTIEHNRNMLGWRPLSRFVMAD